MFIDESGWFTRGEYMLFCLDETKCELLLVDSIKLLALILFLFLSLLEFNASDELIPIDANESFETPVSTGLLLR